jgi:uncharacterized membrane protein YgcG
MKDSLMLQQMVRMVNTVLQSIKQLQPFSLCTLSNSPVCRSNNYVHSPDDILSYVLTPYTSEGNGGGGGGGGAASGGISGVFAATTAGGPYFGSGGGGGV